MKTKRKPKAAPSRDIAVLHGPTEDGQGARLLRFRGDTVTAGEIRPAREGQPLGQAELVRLKPLHRELPVCEVEVLHAPPSETQGEPASEPSRSSPGPARVSNRRYRRNWSQVFGSRPEPEAEPADEQPDFSIN